MPWFEPIRKSPNGRFLSSAGANAGVSGCEEEQEWLDERDLLHGRPHSRNEFSNNSARGDECLTEEDDEELNVQNYLNEQWDYGVDICRRGASEIINNNGHNENRLYNHHLNFDGFQHRVERQLANIFPGEDFPLLSPPTLMNLGQFSWNSALADPTNRHVNSEEYMGNNALTADEKSNNFSSQSRSSGAANVSKTAQFFYPRPVVALQPYNGFFSPMIYPNVDNRLDSMTFNAEVSKSCHDLKPASHMHDCDHFSQIESQRLLHNNHIGDQISHQDQFCKHKYPQTENPPFNGLVDMLEGPNEADDQNHFDGNNHSNNQNRNDDDKASIHRPRKQFEMETSPLSKRHSRKHKLVQTKLDKDPKTGKLFSSPAVDLEKFTATTTTRKKSWDDYGGRVAIRNSTYSENEIDGGVETRGKEFTNSKKKKKENGMKTKKNKEGASSDIDVLFDAITSRHNSSTHLSSNPDSEKRGIVSTTFGTYDYKDVKKSKKLENSSSETARVPRTKNQVLSHQIGFSELDIPLDQLANVDDVVEDCAMPQLTETDFEGIEEMGLQNAGSCAEGLDRFIRHVKNQAHVSWTMLFLDPYTGNWKFGDTDGANSRSRKKRQLANNCRGYECTTPFLPSTKKYCTEKGPICSAWNCTCDSQIRSFRGKAMLIGALFVLQDRADSISKDDNLQNEEHIGEQTFSYLLPLGPTGCASGAIGFSRMATWCSLPFDCDTSLVDRWNTLKHLLCSAGGTKFVTYNAQVQLLPFYYHLMHDEPEFTLDRSNQYQYRHDDVLLSSIWDLKIVSWMLRADASDAELEFTALRESFAHLVSHDKLIQQNHSAPLLTQGLVAAKNDLEFLHKVYPVINQQLIQKQLLSALEFIESPVQSILSAMECRGVSCFPHRLQKIERTLNTRIQQLESKCRSIVDDPEFMLSSPQQVSHYIFDVLKIEVPQGLVSKTKAGSSHRSTSEESLKAIKSDFMNRNGSSPEIIDIILEFRAVNKLLTTYIRGLPKFCRRVKSEGTSKKLPSRIFPQWMQTVARTGRLSCRKPNLQQVPNEGMFGIHPREAFVPSAKIRGRELVLFACDYSQKEVRILAHMSGDEALLSLFQTDKVDIYKQMSSLIRNKPLEEVTAAERSIFKQVTLAILYGMSPNQVGKKLSISKAMAKKMMNDFFRRFRGVKAWMDQTKEFARRNHFVVTISGRRRYLDGINSDDNAIRSQAERQAINTVIQGSSADVMKIAMINMTKNLMEWEDSKTSIRPRILLQIHDELLLELMLNTKDIKRLQSIALKSCCNDCQSYFGLKVPLLVKCSCGLSWGKMKEI